MKDHQILLLYYSRQGPSFFLVSLACEIGCSWANPVKLSNIAQISDIIHFELQFPACDVQTRSDFDGPNQQNQG